MKRNLKFWTRYTWECMEVFLGMTVILGLITLFGAEGLDLRHFASMMPYLLCIGAMFGILLINTGSHTLYVPLLVSMGEPRRNVFLGFHYYRALILAVTTALCALIWLLIPSEVSSIGLRSLPTLLCVLVVAASFGSILGTIFVKWKWLGTIIIVLICGGLGGTIGATSVALVDGLTLANTLELVSAFVTAPWWLILAAVVLFVLDLLFQWMILRRLEVRL